MTRARGAGAERTVTRGGVAGDQAAADVDEGGDGEVAAVVAGEEDAQRRALVEVGEAGAAVAAGEAESSGLALAHRRAGRGERAALAHLRR